MFKPSPAVIAAPRIVRVDRVLAGECFYSVRRDEIRPIVYPAVKPSKPIANALRRDGWGCDDGINVLIISICDWIDYKFPGKKSYEVDYGLACRELEKWCKWHGAYHYAAPRESFSNHAAVDEARRNGCTIVVVEDLS